MDQQFLTLILAALSLGFIHTVLGPDHYLPFIALSKSNNWSAKKTAAITFLCGIGHILGSIILGIIGIFFGIAIANLEFIESVRGELAVWLLMSFGFVYFVWGLRKAYKNTIETPKNPKLNFWVLFIIFILGPCEILIPLLMYPAAQNNYMGAILIALIFGATTILTMTGIVMASHYGLSRINFKGFERYSHSIAGLTILLSGIFIQFSGL